MITEEKKNEIVRAIHREKGLLGSYNNVAKKLGISGASISANLLKPENWSKVADARWTDIAAALGVNITDRVWNLAETSNVKIMHFTLQAAQKEALFMAVSEKAGSGKSASIAAFVEKDKKHAVYALQCEEWSRRSFMVNLSNALGVPAGRYDTAEMITDEIIRFFKQRAKEVQPLLILDEADKLKPGAKRFIIPLYNKLEDEIGLVCVGTENLEKEIKNGVRKAEKGYDEIDSRLGRSFVHLVGYSKQDLAAICRENGVTDPDLITQIWDACKPISKRIMKNANHETMTTVIEDARLIKRKITQAKLRMAKAA
jgi:hypothetical protein